MLPHWVEKPQAICVRSFFFLLNSKMVQSVYVFEKTFLEKRERKKPDNAQSEETKVFTKKWEDEKKTSRECANKTQWLRFSPHVHKLLISQNKTDGDWSIFCSILLSFFEILIIQIYPFQKPPFHQRNQLALFLNITFHETTRNEQIRAIINILKQCFFSFYVKSNEETDMNKLLVCLSQSHILPSQCAWCAKKENKLWRISSFLCVGGCNKRQNK